MKTVIERAREAAIAVHNDARQSIEGELENLERFAALVRADEQMKALESARTIGGDWAAKFEQEYLK